MRSPSSFAKIVGTSTLFATPAAPQTISGASVPVRNCDIGSLSSLVTATLTSGTLTVTAKWQVSDDATTWYDCSPLNNAANVTLATGTGTAVATNKMLEAPQGCYSWNFARVQLVTGAATADGAADAGTVSYRYLKDRW